MKLIKTEHAVGWFLCHDITQIIRGKTKGPVFRKGHRIEAEDIPVLLSVGKDHVYVRESDIGDEWDREGRMLHEDDAALILYSLCRNQNLSRLPDIKEGKVEMIADCDGLLIIDEEAMFRVNSYGQMMIASLHNYFPVRKGQHVAGMRIIPLQIERSKMEEIQSTVGDRPIFTLLPYRKKRVGLVITGNEVFYGRIQDRFTQVAEAKVRAFGAEVIAREVSSDDPVMEVSCIQKVLDAGADLVLCTGGMSVDPDDRTPFAIRQLADRVVSYGSPVLPGAMFMLAYKGAQDEIAMMGLPGCVMYEKRTIFDLILPRVMAGVRVEAEEIARMGVGGYCMHCDPCIFPNCAFGVF